MNRVGAGDLSRGDDAGDAEVTLFGRGGADADVVIGIADVKGIAVGLGMHGDGLDAHLLAGRDDAKGDLAAIGDEDFREHVADRSYTFTAKSFSPYSTGCPFCGKTLTMVPSMSDSISFISFIASMMQRTLPLEMRSPGLTNDSASGFAAR